jgi:SAM-dependent methyltransferase
MDDPRAALHEWWRLVKPGGHLIVIVPDEDLYEQGVFPSRFNPEHRATFTISKARSWSPASLNVLDLACALPGGELVSVQLQDHGYDRRRLQHGGTAPAGRALRLAFRVYRALRRRGWFDFALLDHLQSRFIPLDQTELPEVLAQIQCIVRKRP